MYSAATLIKTCNDVFDSVVLVTAVQDLALVAAAVTIDAAVAMIRIVELKERAGNGFHSNF